MKKICKIAIIFSFFLAMSAQKSQATPGHNNDILFLEECDFSSISKNSKNKSTQTETHESPLSDIQLIKKENLNPENRTYTSSPSDSQAEEKKGVQKSTSENTITPGSFQYLVDSTQTLRTRVINKNSSIKCKVKFKGGDGMNNGGGLAEARLQNALTHLKFYLKLCLTTSICKFNAEETIATEAVLNFYEKNQTSNLLESLHKEVKNQINEKDEQGNLIPLSEKKALELTFGFLLTQGGLEKDKSFLETAPKIQTLLNAIQAKISLAALGHPNVGLLLLNLSNSEKPTFKLVLFDGVTTQDISQNVIEEIQKFNSSPHNPICKLDPQKVNTIFSQGTLESRWKKIETPTGSEFLSYFGHKFMANLIMICSSAPNAKYSSYLEIWVGLKLNKTTQLIELDPSHLEFNFKY